MTQIQATPSFGDYLRGKVGANWVIARRTPRIISRYGEGVVCLTSKRYADLERQFEIETYGAPLKSIQEAAPELLAALKAWQAFARAKPTENDISMGATIPIKEFNAAQELTRAAIAKAEGR